MTPSQITPATAADAFTREVIRNKLLAIAGEMGIVLARTSMSPIVYEVLDASGSGTYSTKALLTQ